MSKVNYIVLIGAYGVGKSVGAQYLRRSMTDLFVRQNVTRNVVVDSYDMPLRHFIATMLGEKWAEMNHHKARPELSGFSVMAFIKSLCEDHLLEKYGTDLFARTLVHRNLKHSIDPNKEVPDIVIVDGGVIGDDSYYLTKPKVIYIKRDGVKDFIKPSHPYRVIDNNGTPEAFYRQLDVLAQELVNENLNDDAV